MKKSELRQIIKEEIKRLNEHHLKPGTPVLYIKNRTLTPAKIVRHHDMHAGSDWYWIADKKGNEELLYLADRAKPNKAFELVNH